MNESEQRVDSGRSVEAVAEDVVNAQDPDTTDAEPTEELLEEIEKEEQETGEEESEEDEENPDDPTHDMPPLREDVVTIAPEVVNEWVKALDKNSLIVLFSNAPLLRQSAMAALFNPLAQ